MSALQAADVAAFHDGRPREGWAKAAQWISEGL